MHWVDLFWYFENSSGSSSIAVSVAAFLSNLSLPLPVSKHAHTHSLWNANTHTNAHTHCIRLCPEGLSDEGKERKLSETPKLEWEMITMEVSIKEGKNSLESNILQIHMSKQKRVCMCACVRARERERKREQ